jgi:hypothetical protein
MINNLTRVIRLVHNHSKPYCRDIERERAQ